MQAAQLVAMQVRVLGAIVIASLVTAPFARDRPAAIAGMFMVSDSDGSKGSRFFAGSANLPSILSRLVTRSLSIVPFI